MNCHSYYEYINMNGETFFTIILLPEKEGAFPTVIFRTPYVKDTVNLSEEEIIQSFLTSFSAWAERGYAVVYQHRRGQGKSTGAFVPYIFEREDGISLREWIRSQPFYNGELFLFGGSYCASLHYATAPFENDVKGAVLEVQDTDRYRLWYRNGQMRKGHANWHFHLYKNKCDLDKKFSMKSFAKLPLKDLSEKVMGDRAEDFEQMLSATHPSHEFWSTRFGGAENKNVTDNANIPILFTTGYNDFYVGGIFKMWNAMSESTKEKCALLVSPYNHGDGLSKEYGLTLPKGKRIEEFGRRYQIDWLDNVRMGTPLPCKKGVISYYRTFEDKWESDFYAKETKDIRIPLGSGISSFRYDPLDPPAFFEEGSTKDEDFGTAAVSIYTAPAEKDIFIKGNMRALLTVDSDCPDTSFYIRISIKKPEYTYSLRHDITSLCYQLGDYTPGTPVEMSFSFDEYAFLLKKGDQLRIDISSTDDNTYVSHTNKKGPYHLQTETAVATNRVYLDKSFLILPIE